MIKIILQILSPHKNIRAFNVICAIIYTLVFRDIYRDYLTPVWGYMGYQVNNTALNDILIANFLCVFPIFFFKVDKIISNFISIILYIMVHVPSVIALQYYYHMNDGLIYELLFTVAMIMFFMAGTHRKSKEHYTRKTNLIPYHYYNYAGIMVMLTLLFVYRGNLHFVSFADVYDLRSDNDVVAESNPIVGYIQLWAANLFAPLFISVGLLRKDFKAVLYGCGFSIIVYMATGLKGAILTPVIVLSFHYLLSKIKSDKITYFFPVVTLITLVVFLSGAAIKDETINMLYGILFMRTFGIAALNTPVYIEVFAKTPYTYYSHINVVNKITGMYPFTNPSMGTAVYEQYMGREGVANANANFLVTDGIAACGSLGIILIAVVFYFILVYLNKLSNNHDKNFILCSFSAIIMALSNVSLFTTLVSCGMLISMLCMRFTNFNYNN